MPGVPCADDAPSRDCPRRGTGLQTLPLENNSNEFSKEFSEFAVNQLVVPVRVEKI
jgi:hypothetical protein